VLKTEPVLGESSIIVGINEGRADVIVIAFGGGGGQRQQLKR